MGGTIELKGLTKRFGGGGSAGGILAVESVSFRVEPGEVLGFLGPNGAGKSTTMRMLTGYLAPTAGTALVCGHDVVQDSMRARERLGYLPEGAPAYPDMTPEGFLRFAAGVRGLKGSARAGAIERAVDSVKLGEVMRQSIDTLSKGFKRRVGLAQAILHDPEVLVMDEPTDGLDPNQKHDVRELIKRMAGGGGKAIVLSTHILEEVEAVCTRVVLIARGRVIADATPAQFAARSRHHNAVRLVVSGVSGAALGEELSRVAGVREVEVEGEACTALSKGGRSIAGEVAQLVASKGWKVSSMRVEEGRMDEVFRELTQGAGREGA